MRAAVAGGWYAVGGGVVCGGSDVGAAVVVVGRSTVVAGWITSAVVCVARSGTLLALAHAVNASVAARVTPSSVCRPAGLHMSASARWFSSRVRTCATRECGGPRARTAPWLTNTSLMST